MCIRDRQEQQRAFSDTLLRIKEESLKEKMCIRDRCKKAESQNRKIKEPVCDSAFLLMDIVYFTLTEEVLLQVE